MESGKLESGKWRAGKWESPGTGMTSDEWKMESGELESGNLQGTGMTSDEWKMESGKWKCGVWGSDEPEGLAQRSDGQRPSSTPPRSTSLKGSHNPASSGSGSDRFGAPRPTPGNGPARQLREPFRLVVLPSDPSMGVAHRYVVGARQAPWSLGIVAITLRVMTGWMRRHAVTKSISPASSSSARRCRGGGHAIEPCWGKACSRQAPAATEDRHRLHDHPG